MYTTNNIVETINSKLDFYLKKGITNNISFFNCMTQILSVTENEFNINNNSKRHDYITRTFIKIIESNYFSNGFKWITYKDFLEFEKRILYNENEELSSLEIDNLIEFIDGKNINLNLINNEEISNDKVDEEENEFKTSSKNIIIEEDNIKRGKENDDEENELSHSEEIYLEDIKDSNCNNIMKLLELLDINDPSDSLVNNIEYKEKENNLRDLNNITKFEKNDNIIKDSINENKLKMPLLERLKEKDLKNNVKNLIEVN